MACLSWTRTSWRERMFFAFSCIIFSREVVGTGPTQSRRPVIAYLGDGSLAVHFGTLVSL